MDVSIPMGQFVAPTHAGGAQGAQGAANVQAVDPNEDPVGAVKGAMYARIDALIGQGKPGVGKPNDRPQGVSAQIVKAVNTLYNKGIDTPDKVDQFNTGTWFHEMKMAATVGVAKNAAYAIFMSAALETLVPKIEKHSSSTEEFGAALGATIALADHVGAEFLGAPPKALMLNGRGSSGSMPPEVQEQESEIKRIALEIGRGALANVAKNSLRIPAPWVQKMIENSPDGLINARTASWTDLSIDALGGLFSGAVTEMLKVGASEQHAANLFLGDKLGAVIDKSRQTWAKSLGDMGQAVVDTAVSLLRNSPTHAAIVASYVVAVSSLAKVNEGIDKQGALDYQNRNNATLPQGRVPAEAVMNKRISSVGHIGGLSFVAPLVANLVQKGWDALLEKGSEALTQWTMSKTMPQGRPEEAQAVADAAIQKAVEAIKNTPLDSSARKLSDVLRDPRSELNQALFGSCR